MLPLNSSSPFIVTDALCLITKNVDKPKDVRSIRQTCTELHVHQGLKEIESQLQLKKIESQFDSTELRDMQLAALEVLGLERSDDNRNHLIEFANGVAQLFNGQPEHEITRLGYVVMDETAASYYQRNPTLENIASMKLCKDIPMPSYPKKEWGEDARCMNMIKREIITQQKLVAGFPISFEEALQKQPELTLKNLTNQNLDPKENFCLTQNSQQKEQSSLIALFTTIPSLMCFHFGEINHIEKASIDSYLASMQPAEQGCTIL
jgi:hypothetical protein